jgi:hypothetical protein
MAADDPRTGKSIVPEDKNKQLSLSAELIHRGLELATRIELNQGIQPSPQNLAMRKEYMVLCYPAIMEWFQDDGGHYKLRDTDRHAGGEPPVYIYLSIDQDGLHISCVPINVNRNLQGIENNDNHYRLLNAFNNLNPFTIPFSSFGLYYKLTHPVQKDVRFQMGPSGPPGYIGAVTKEANSFYNKNEDCVETIIIYISLLGDPSLKQGLVKKNPPLKISFVVTNEKGEDDRAASYKLYHAILEAKKADRSKTR